MAYHVSKARFAQLVEQALAELPPQFARFLEEVPLEIKDRPGRKLLRSLGMDDDELLLGLYQGHALTHRSVEYSAGTPGDRALDVIYIFQEDVELVSDNEEQLKREVRTTVLHEIGHHFGLDEDELDRLGYGWGRTHGDDEWRVSALDLAAAKRALNTSAPAVAGRFDFDRDGRVNALDLAALKQNLSRALAPIPSTLSTGTPAPATSGLFAAPCPGAVGDTTLPIWEGPERGVL